MTYTEALKYIEGVSWLGSKPGLSRMTELMAALGDPQDSLRYIHVAGTNGKGSTSAMLAEILKCAGYKTGLYTSPYLWRFNERMRIDGRQIPDEALAEVVEILKPAADGMSDPCTEFELVTAAAFLWFAREKCDVVVLEVGLGGRLDATNIIKYPVCSVITNIGLDHTAVLGDSLESIAFEKAGILKGGPAVSYEQTPGVAAVLTGAAEFTGTALRFADFSRIESLSDGVEGQRFRVGEDEYRLPLLGRHQLNNSATALLAVDSLRNNGWEIPEAAVERGLAQVEWPARFELMMKRPYFIVDGGHNPQCVETTARSLRKYFPDKKRVLLIGVMADKDWREMTDILNEVADAWVAVTPESERALPARELADWLALYGKPVRCEKSVRDGVLAAMTLAGEDGAACSVGSLYMAGAVRDCFGRH